MKELNICPEFQVDLNMMYFLSAMKNAYICIQIYCLIYDKQHHFSHISSILIIETNNVYNICRSMTFFQGMIWSFAEKDDEKKVSNASSMETPTISSSSKISCETAKSDKQSKCTY